MANITKTPRLYTDAPLSAGQAMMLDGNPHHYLRNVMRANAGETLRLFNGRDGEFTAQITTVDKKTTSINIQNQLKPQPEDAPRRILVFSPLKKERMDFLIEKSVELGVTDLQPVTMQHSDIRQINEDRLNAQIVEAAEQCERLTLPALRPITDLMSCIRAWDKSIPLFAAMERMDALALSAQNKTGGCGLLIGPAGGFSEEEKAFVLAQTHVRCVSLGENILRAETAAIAGLSVLTL